MARVSSVIRDENRWECEGPVQHRFEEAEERRTTPSPPREVELQR